MFIHGPDKRLTRFALSLKRQGLRIGLRTVYKLLTSDHTTLTRHLTAMKTRTDPLPVVYGG